MYRNVSHIEISSKRDQIARSDRQAHGNITVEVSGTRFSMRDQAGRLTAVSQRQRHGECAQKIAENSPGDRAYLPAPLIAG